MCSSVHAVTQFELAKFLPMELVELATEFTDPFDHVSKKSRINAAICEGYDDWLLDRTCCCPWRNSEYQAKCSIWGPMPPEWGWYPGLEEEFPQKSHQRAITWMCFDTFQFLELLKFIQNAEDRLNHGAVPHDPKEFMLAYERFFTNAQFDIFNSTKYKIK